jgi:hypothetical protein
MLLAESGRRSERMREPILVKRYAGSRLYDTSKARYVTVEELREWRNRRIAFEVREPDGRGRVRPSAGLTGPREAETNGNAAAPPAANRLRAAARSGQETRETAEIGLFDTGLWVLASSPRSSGSMCRFAARLQQSSSRLCCLLWSAPPRPRAFRLRSVAWFSAARRVGAECARRDRATDVDQDP